MGKYKTAIAAIFLQKSGDVISGEIRSTAQNQYHISSGGISTFWRFDGNDIYLMFSHTKTGGYNSLRPFAINKSGVVKLGANLSIGAAQVQTNGNVVGSIWSNWGSNDAYTAINNRIETRARGYADDRKNSCVTDTRVAGWVEWDNATAGRNVWNHTPSGYFVTSTKQDTSSTVQARYFAARQPQIYIPAVGWRALGGW